jgi:hypothetical protein
MIKQMGSGLAITHFIKQKNSVQLKKLAPPLKPMIGRNGDRVMGRQKYLRMRIAEFKDKRTRSN